MKSKKIKLDIACGNNLQKGFVGVDIIGKPETQAKIVHNLLTFPYPFKDNSVDEIFCSHFIEHLPHRDSFNDYFFDFFNELDNDNFNLLNTRSLSHCRGVGGI